MGCCTICSVGILMLARACGWLNLSDLFLLELIERRLEMRQIKDVRWERTRQYSTLKNPHRQKFRQNFLFWKLSWWGAQWQIFLPPLIEAHHFAVLYSVVSAFMTLLGSMIPWVSTAYHECLTNLSLPNRGCMFLMQEILKRRLCRRCCTP